MIFLICTICSIIKETSEVANVLRLGQLSVGMKGNVF